MTTLSDDDGSVGLSGSEDLDGGVGLGRSVAAEEEEGEGIVWETWLSVYQGE